MRGDSGVAGEGRVVGVPTFHSWGQCTMPLTNINSDWMSKASSGLRLILLFRAKRGYTRVQLTFFVVVVVVVVVVNRKLA